MKRKGIISIVLLIFSIGLIIIYYTYSSQENEVKIEKVNKYKDYIIQNNKESIINKEEYQGLLEITKINLLLGFYNNDSSENNVNKNIQKIGNDTPDMKNATIILAAHSGNSYLGYFKNLDKLNINDFINI